jgi:hypothetical protein
MEFALIAIPFLFMMIAIADLGRFMMTVHSLRTVAAEAARAVMLNCFNSGSCALTGPQRTAAERSAPFLVPAQLTLNASQTENTTTQVRTITVSAQYPFSFIFLPWTSIGSPMTESYTFTY